MSEEVKREEQKIPETSEVGEPDTPDVDNTEAETTRFSKLEEEILSVIRSEPESRFAAVTYEKQDPGLLYQLSPWRANLIDWLPVKARDSVLEMQAGYGPLTADIAAKAGEVVCLEQTPQQYMINSLRQTSRKNVQCGLWQLTDEDEVSSFLEREGKDAENSVRKFDWVIVYMPDSPFSVRTNVELAEEFTAENGHIVLAVDNKNGLRTTDGGEIPKGAVTKRELERLFSGLKLSAEFYYPYPSLEFPDSIYSDRFLPREEELHDYNESFGKPRVCWFHEQEEYALALQRGIFPDVTNAYLCILTRESRDDADDKKTSEAPELTVRELDAEGGEDADQVDQPSTEEAQSDSTQTDEPADESAREDNPVDDSSETELKESRAQSEGTQAKEAQISAEIPVYIKFSNQRRPGFNIVTSIYENNDGTRQIIKRAFDEESKPWIHQISEKTIDLNGVYSGTKLKINRCERTVDMIRPEYLTGTSLDSLLDDCLFFGHEDKAEELIDEYWNRLVSGHPIRKFEVTDEYREVFGDNVIEGGVPSLPKTDIDMIFSNILISEKAPGEEEETGRRIDQIKEEDWSVIDCEWTFDFPIPIRFVMYRALSYFENYRRERSSFVEKLYGKYGITPDDRKVYEKMEEKFQKWILGPTWPIRLHYVKYGTADINVPDMYPDCQDDRDLIRKLMDEKLDLEKRVAQNEETIRGCQENIRAFQDTIDEIHNSTSWKITKPLRAIIRFFRKLFRKRNQ